jgi:RNA polymerase sigma factor (sigma-70 family)
MNDHQLERAAVQLSQGCQRAFKSLFGYFYQPLCLFSFRVQGIKEDAQEIVDDVFVKLWERRDQFSTATKVKAFLLVSVRNKSINCIKERIRRENINKNKTGYWPSSQEHPDDLEQAAELEQVRIEVLLEMEKAINSFGRLRRLIMQLVRMGFRNPEIALILNISSNSVAVQKSQAIKELREFFLLAESPH